jgi:hypothetical protein
MERGFGGTQNGIGSLIGNKVSTLMRVRWDAAENSDESKSQVVLSDVSR